MDREMGRVLPSYDQPRRKLLILRRAWERLTLVNISNIVKPPNIINNSINKVLRVTSVSS